MQLYKEIPLEILMLKNINLLLKNMDVWMLVTCLEDESRHFVLYTLRRSSSIKDLA